MFVGALKTQIFNDLALMLFNVSGEEVITVLSFNSLVAV